jgi:hypothetical protein
MTKRQRQAMNELSQTQIEQFLRDGFVKIERAFPRELADEARSPLEEAIAI